MARIFISYRRQPFSQAVAGRVYDRLVPKFRAENVFLDVDMEPGVDFVEVINDKVKACDVFIALVAADWQPERMMHPGDWVRLEISAALDRNICLIPVLVDGARLPAESEVPQRILPLLRRNALEIRYGSFNQDVEKLVRAIERGINSSERAPFVNPPDGLTYVWIPAGTFTMGGSPGDDDVVDDERPAHEVEISRGFWMSQTPVTQFAWRRVMGNDPSHFKGDSLPVETVTWERRLSFAPG